VSFCPGTDLSFKPSADLVTVPIFYLSCIRKEIVVFRINRILLKIRITSGWAENLNINITTPCKLQENNHTDFQLYKVFNWFHSIPFCHLNFEQRHILSCQSGLNKSVNFDNVNDNLVEIRIPKKFSVCSSSRLFIGWRYRQKISSES
jgi:hypothetical protein